MKESKVWIMVAVCFVTSNVNLQVCEMKDTGSMLEALVRLSCECGYPKYIACDKESSILAASKNINVNLRDLQHRLYREYGALIEECAVPPTVTERSSVQFDLYGIAWTILG